MALLILDKTDFRTNCITKDQERYFILLKKSSQFIS